jgi:hypothetical protein
MKGYNVKFATDTVVDQFSLETAASSPVKEKSAPYAWIIWSTAALFYLYEYVLRASPGVMTNELMHDFGVTSTA